MTHKSAVIRETLELWFITHTFDSMFMPIASPVWDCKRMYRFLPAKLTCSRSRRANLRNTQSYFRAEVILSTGNYPTAVLYRVHSVCDLCPLTCWCDRRPVWWHWTPLDSPSSPWPPPPDTPTASEPPALESFHPPEHDCSRHPTTTDTRETALSDETLNIREKETQSMIVLNKIKTMHVSTKERRQENNKELILKISR